MYEPVPKSDAGYGRDKASRRELEVFVERIDKWISGNQAGHHTHIGKINSIFLAGYIDSLPPGLLHDVLVLADDAECASSLSSVGLN